MSKQIFNSEILTIGVLAIGGFAVWNMTKGIQQTSQAVGSTFQGVGSGISTAVQGAGVSASEIFKDVAGAFTSAFNLLFKTSQAAGNVVTTAGQAASEVITTTGTQGANVVTSAGTSASKLLDIPGNIADIPNALLDAAENWIKKNINPKTTDSTTSQTQTSKTSTSKTVLPLSSAPEYTGLKTSTSNTGNNKIITSQSTSSISVNQEKTPQTGLYKGVTLVTKQPGYVYNVDKKQYVKI